MERLADTADAIDGDVRRRGGVLLVHAKGIYIFPHTAMTPELQARAKVLSRQLRLLLSSRAL